MAKPEVVVPRGTWITCPGCGSKIGKLNRDAYRGQRLAANQVIFVAHQARAPGEKARCRDCGAGFMQVMGSPKGLHLACHFTGGWKVL